MVRKLYTYRDGRYVPSRFPATGKFYTEGIHIVDPQGRKFVPRGFNVAGGKYNNGGAWPNMAENNDVANGMKTWHVNTIRLTSAVGRTAGWMLLAERLAAGDTLEVARSKVLAEWIRMTDFWLGHGMVVMLEAHDLTYPANVTAENMEDVKQFWLAYAAHYKNNPNVWYNLANEPAMNVATWKSWHADVATAIRATGDDSIIVIDGRMFASDLEAPFLRDDEMIPTLIRNHGNIIASMHNYGTGMRMWASEAQMRSYFSAAARAKIPQIIGEIGYSWNQNTNTGDWAGERMAAHSVCTVAPEFGIGVFWWVYAHADSYRIEDAVASNNVTNPFRAGTAHLNEAGLLFKNYLAESKARN